MTNFKIKKKKIENFDFGNQYVNSPTKSVLEMIHYTKITTQNKRLRTIIT